MNCPLCGTHDASVLKTMKTGRVILRQRACECGATWPTEEKIVAKATFMQTGVIRRRIDPETNDAVLKRDGYACRYCGETEALGIDHIVPLSAPIPAGVSRPAEADRRNGIDNLCACCLPCNMKKGDTLNYRPRPIETSSDQSRDSSAANENAEKGRNLSLIRSVPISSPILEADPERAREGVSQVRKVRGKAKEYSSAFEDCWRQYGRKDEKAEAFRKWGQLASELGEDNLRGRVLTALKWQGPNWATKAWEFAPYFERYLKRRKWEDEQSSRAEPQSYGVARDWALRNEGGGNG